MPSFQTVCLKTFYLKHEAELAQGFLEANGIMSTLSAGDAGGMRPDYVYGLGGIRLFVKKSDEQKARDLLGSL